MRGSFCMSAFFHRIVKMLLGKYLNKYYLKYWYMFIVGVLSLVTIDYMQLFLPRRRESMHGLRNEDCVLTQRGGTPPPQNFIEIE